MWRARSASGSSDSCHCAAVLASIASLYTLPLLMMCFEEDLYIDPAPCQTLLEGQDSLNRCLAAGGGKGEGWRTCGSQQCFQIVLVDQYPGVASCAGLFCLQTALINPPSHC